MNHLQIEQALQEIDKSLFCQFKKGFTFNNGRTCCINLFIHKKAGRVDSVLLNVGILYSETEGVLERAVHKGVFYKDWISDEHKPEIESLVKRWNGR